MTTLIHTCKPHTGWQWIVQGFNLFRSKPGEFFFFGNTYLFIIFFPMVLLPVFGAVIVTLITPALSVGVMTAGRMALKNQYVLPKTLFTAFFKENRIFLQRLFALGCIYTAYFTVVRLIDQAVLGPPPEFSVQPDQEVTPEMATEITNYLIKNLVFVGLFNIPIILAFWFAPVLVVWHNMPAGKALFASWIAVWRNKGAFLVYGTALIGLLIGGAITLSLVLLGLGLPPFLLSVLNLVAIAIAMGIGICTIYPSYRSIWGVTPLEKPGLNSP